MARTAPPGLGLLKGLGITLKHMLKPAATQQYPHERPELEPRTRGVIALMDENCTVCMLCGRECPDWCIYIDSHKETVPPAKEGGRARTRNVLDRFAIDFALCMYCGICVEVCPFDALWWSPEFEYAEYEIDGLLHEMGRLREWMDTVPAPPPLDEGAIQPAEVADALAKAEQAALEAQKAAEEAEAKALDEKAGGDGDGGDAAVQPKKAEVKVEAGEIDQETYDKLIAEGKSERIARAKAKAAYVRKAKKAAREAEAEKPAPEVKVEGRRDRPGDLRQADRGGQERADRPCQGEGCVRPQGQAGRPAPRPRRPRARRRRPRRTPRPAPPAVQRPRTRSRSRRSSRTSWSRARSRSTPRPTTG